MNETNDVLTLEERGGMTIFGEAISAQIRYHDDHGDRTELALYIRDDAPRSTEDGHPAILPAGDVQKLRALLEEAERRAHHQHEREETRMGVNPEIDQKRAMRSGLSRKLRDLNEMNEMNRCPSCGRKGALKRVVNVDFVVRYCRYEDCDYERGGYVQ